MNTGRLSCLAAATLGLEQAARQLERDLPERVRAVMRYDQDLSHRMYAGGDLLLMPSRYEPCGLAQMIAMRYGCLPVAHATGGLRDTIFDLDDPARSTGFLFENATSEALSAALRRGLAAYCRPNRLAGAPALCHAAGFLLAAFRPGLFQSLSRSHPTIP